MNKTKWPEKKICDRYLRGEGSTTIARSLNTTDGTICNILRRNKITMRKRGESNRLYSLNENAFSKITDESAYWAGFLMADGNIRYKGRNQYVLSLEIAYKDIEHLKRFQKFLNTNKPIYERKRIICNGTQIHVVSLQICSEKIYKDLISNFNVTENKSFNAKANNILVYNRHFWRGMIDGDGCVCNKKGGKNGYFNIHLIGSLDICKQFKKYLKTTVEIKSNICKKGKIFSMHANGQYGIKLGEILYKDTSLYLERKYVKWLSRYEQSQNNIRRSIL